MPIARENLRELTGWQQSPTRWRCPSLIRPSCRSHWPRALINRKPLTGPPETGLASIVLTGAERFRYGLSRHLITIPLVMLQRRGCGRTFSTWSRLVKGLHALLVWKLIWASPTPAWCPCSRLRSPTWFGFGDEDRMAGAVNGLVSTAAIWSAGRTSVQGVGQHAAKGDPRKVAKSGERIRHLHQSRETPARGPAEFSSSRLAQLFLLPS